MDAAGSAARNFLISSRNSTGAGIATLITTSTYTMDEDFTEAARVVPELGDAPNAQITLAELDELVPATAA